MINYLLPVLFYCSPSVELNTEEIRRFKTMEQRMHDEGALFELARDEVQSGEEKLRYLIYLSKQKRYVFHGSNDSHIEQFEPREQTLFNGNLTKAVFSSSDPTWSIFYAVLNRSRLKGGFRNGCLIGKHQKFHFYSLNKSTMDNDPWTDGMVYIFSNKHFKLSGQGKVRFDEWICHELVTPLSKIKVTRNDFYFKNKVSVHGDRESIAKTWLLYKARTIFNKLN